MKLNRPKEAFNNNCSYKLFADNVEIAKLKNGQEIEIELPANCKTITAKLSFCGSNTINVAELKNDESLEITGNEFFNKYMPVSGSAVVLLAFTIDKYILAIRIVSMVIVFAVLLYAVWTLTFGRNKWLKIERKQI